MYNIYTGLLQFIKENNPKQEIPKMRFDVSTNIFYMDLNRVLNSDPNIISSYISTHFLKLIKNAYDVLQTKQVINEALIFININCLDVIIHLLSKNIVYIDSYETYIKLNFIMYYLSKINNDNKVHEKYLKISSIINNRFNFSLIKFNFKNNYANYLPIVKNSSFSLIDSVIRIDFELTHCTEFTNQNIKQRAANFKSPSNFIATLLTSLFNNNDWFYIFPILMLDAYYYNNDQYMIPECNDNVNQAILEILNTLPNLEIVLDNLGEYHNTKKYLTPRFSIVNALSTQQNSLKRLYDIVMYYKNIIYIP